MSSDSRLLLAVRTILVTTRVAVRAHRMAGKEDLAQASARRGAELLKKLSQELPPDAAETLELPYREAKREVESFMMASSDERRGDP